MADSSRLANALQRIAKIVERPSDDPLVLVDMLNDIQEAAGEGKSDYLANVMAEQRAELERLRGGKRFKGF